MAENRQQQIPRCTLMYWPNSETVEPLGAVPSVASLIIGAATGPSAGGWLLGERSSAGSYRSSSHQDRLAQSLSLWMNHNRFSASHEDTWGWNFHYRALLRRIGESLCVCESISPCVCVFPLSLGFSSTDESFIGLSLFSSAALMKCWSKRFDASSIEVQTTVRGAGEGELGNARALCVFFFTFTHFWFPSKESRGLLNLQHKGLKGNPRSMGRSGPDSSQRTVLFKEHYVCQQNLLTSPVPEVNDSFRVLLSMFSLFSMVSNLLVG